jgi:hypothetical protein
LIHAVDSPKSCNFRKNKEIPPALPQFSGSKIAEREEKINIKTAKME